MKFQNNKKKRTAVHNHNADVYSKTGVGVCAINSYVI